MKMVKKTHRIGSFSGLAQIPILIGLVIMAVAIPIATNLVQQVQENRSKAASDCVKSSGRGNGCQCLNDKLQLDSTLCASYNCVRENQSAICKEGLKCNINGILYESGKTTCITVNPNDLLKRYDVAYKCVNGIVAKTDCSVGQRCEMVNNVATCVSGCVYNGKVYKLNEGYCDSQYSISYICNVNNKFTPINCSDNEKCVDGRCVAEGGQKDQTEKKTGDTSKCSDSVNQSESKCKNAGCAWYFSTKKCDDFGSDDECTKGSAETENKLGSCKESCGKNETKVSGLCLSKGSFYGKTCCVPKAEEKEKISTCAGICYTTKVGSPSLVPSICSGYDTYYPGYSYIKAEGTCTNGGICCDKKDMCKDLAKCDGGTACGKDAGNGWYCDCGGSNSGVNSGRTCTSKCSTGYHKSGTDCVVDTVPPVCGNDKVETGEECDGATTAGEKCFALYKGYDQIYTVACSGACKCGFTKKDATKILYLFTKFDGKDCVPGAYESIAACKTANSNKCYINEKECEDANVVAGECKAGTNGISVNRPSGGFACGSSWGSNKSGLYKCENGVWTKSRICATDKCNDGASSSSCEDECTLGAYKCFDTQTSGYCSAGKWDRATCVPGDVCTCKSNEVCNAVNGVCQKPGITCPKKTLGDANCDGEVDGLDYSIWRGEFIDKKQTVINGQSVWAADFDGKDGVTGVDYSIWRQTYLK